jgi:hypothetical protein
MKLVKPLRGERSVLLRKKRLIMLRSRREPRRGMKGLHLLKRARLLELLRS